MSNAQPATKLPWKRMQWAGVPVLEGETAVASFMDEQDCHYALEACNSYPELQAKLADLKKPCVWTWYPKFSCYETSCGEGLGPGSSIGVKKAFTFCPYCGHPISAAALADTEHEEGGE